MHYTIENQQYGAFLFLCDFPIRPPLGHIGSNLCFFAREDLDAWLRRVRVKSQDEIDSGAARYLVGRERNR